MKNTTNPTRKATRSRAALLARRRELDSLRIIRASLDARRPDQWRSNSRNVLLVDLGCDLPGVRMHRRDVLIARETISAPRNALVAVTLERDGEDDVELGLWAKGGERVVTLTTPEGEERVFLREELTYIGLVIGYIRREDRRAWMPPLHVFKTGGAA